MTLACCHLPSDGARVERVWRLTYTAVGALAAGVTLLLIGGQQREQQETQSEFTDALGGIGTDVGTHPLEYVGWGFLVIAAICAIGAVVGWVTRD